MLVYHPVSDAYHCVFRLLAILDLRSSLEVDLLRILDFVLCFPSVAGEFRMPQNMAALRRDAKAQMNVYRSPLNAKTMFLNLRPTHDGALACLASSGFLVPDELQHGRAVRTVHSLPTNLQERCKGFQRAESVFFSQLMPAFLSLPLHGANGLKDRSGLMEYRYDNV